MSPSSLDISSNSFGRNHGTKNLISFLRSPEFAAQKIYNGLIKSNSFEIHFPKQLTLILKFLRILPYKIYLFLVDKLVKR